MILSLISVAFFFLIWAGTRSVALRAALASRRSTASGGEAEAKRNGAFVLASTVSWASLFLGVAAALDETSPAAFAQRSSSEPETADRFADGSERAAARRFDPLRRDALGVQTRYPAVAKIVGRDKAQTRDDGSQTIPLYYGTGTFVAELGEWGIVVSNWHVVSEARDSIVAKFPTFSSPARVILRDATWDLAALVVRKPPRVAPIPISQAVPDVGDALWVAGYGESAGLTEFQIQGGRVQNYALLVAENDESETGAVDKGADERDAGKLTNGVAPSAAVAELAAARPENALLYETLAVDKGVRKGDSGGPIFNRYGELAGVLWGSNGESTMGTYCIRVQYFLTQAIERLASLEAERLLDASAGDLLSWRLEDGVADAEGTELWARAALEKSGVYPISQRPIYVAADGRETPENLRRVGVENANKRVKAALIVAENATATALPPSPPVFSPTFVKQQGLQYCARPEVAETGFWTNLVEAKRDFLIARRTAEEAKVRETSVVDEADSSANVELAFAAENARNADFADDPTALVALGKPKGLDGPTTVSLRKPSATEDDGAQASDGEASADWESDEETNDAEKTENREDEEKTDDSAASNDKEETSVSENDAAAKDGEKRVKFNGFYLNNIQIYLIICAIFCLFYNAARLMTDADLKKERQKQTRAARARTPEGRDD